MFTLMDCRIKGKKSGLKKQFLISNAKERSRVTSGTV